MNARYTLPSLPGNIKGKLNSKVIIFTSHFLDFEHLIEYPQLCLFNLAYIISKRTPGVSTLAIYMPLETALTSLLLSTRTSSRSLSVRSSVPGIYTYSGWSNPLTPFCQYYSVAHPQRPTQAWWQRSPMGNHSPHQWKYLWRILVPGGRKTYSWEPHPDFGKGLPLVHFACAQWASRHLHVRISDISLTFLHNVPHRQFFSIRASTHLIGVTLYAGTNKDNQVNSLHSDGRSALANVLNVSRLLSKAFPLYQVQRHPTGASRPSTGLNKRGDLWVQEVF